MPAVFEHGLDSKPAVPVSEVWSSNLVKYANFHHADILVSQCAADHASWDLMLGASSILLTFTNCQNMQANAEKHAVHESRLPNVAKERGPFELQSSVLLCLYVKPALSAMSVLFSTKCFWYSRAQLGVRVLLSIAMENVNSVLSNHVSLHLDQRSCNKLMHLVRSGNCQRVKS